jgi:hypothetical protein
VEQLHITGICLVGLVVSTQVRAVVGLHTAYQLKSREECPARFEALLASYNCVKADFSSCAVPWLSTYSCKFVQHSVAIDVYVENFLRILRITCVL